VQIAASGLSEEALEERRLDAPLFAALAAILRRHVAEDLLDVTAAAGVRRFVALGALNALAHGLAE